MVAAMCIQQLTELIIFCRVPTRFLQLARKTFLKLISSIEGYLKMFMFRFNVYDMFLFMKAEHKLAKGAPMMTNRS